MTDEELITDEELWDMYITACINQGVTIDRLFNRKEEVISYLRIVERYDEHTPQYKYANKEIAKIQLGIRR